VRTDQRLNRHPLDDGRDVRSRAGHLFNTDYLSTLPGANAVRAASLFGETDPIHTFRTPDQLVAFAGLDPGVYQTGQYEAPHRRISKRGSPYLAARSG
jgi:transposase